MRAPRHDGSSSRRRGRRRSTRRLSPLLAVLLVILGFAVSGGAGTGAYFYPALAAAASSTGQTTGIKHQPTPSPSAGQPAGNPAAGQQPFTILLLGSDNDAKFAGGQLLTQSMILVRVDPAAQKVTMLSIPRDLQVPIASGGRGKIMEAFAYGGAKNAIQTVEQDFDVQIDDYVWIGLQGLVKLVDYVGGIDVVTTNPVMDDQYPNDVGTSNPYGLKRLAVMPGPQHMNGLQALEYVRSRHSDAREDFGRSFRQQQVLVALRAKAKGLNPSDLPDLAQAFNGELQTSMSVDKARQLLPIATRLQPSDINQVVMVGPEYTSDSSAGGGDVLLPNWDSVLPLVHRYFPSTG
jgi:LCP family protein required for cell wall assembly